MLGLKLMPEAWRGAPEWKLEVWSQGSMNVKFFNKTWNTSFWELATFFEHEILKKQKNRKESHQKA
jgi:hypothetical protein